MNKYALLVSAALGTAMLAGCAGTTQEAAGPGGNPFATASFQSIIKHDFADKGQAKVSRLKQTQSQYECSKYAYLGEAVPADVAKEIESKALSGVVYPADGKYLGNWKEGLKVAEDGKGMQWSDKPGTPNGGNCMACHRMIANDPSQGTIGPALYHYGKLRGDSEAVLKYTWARIYNSESFNSCSFMPPFGAHKILTEQQMKDVMALLMDPNSPVNR